MEGCRARKIKQGCKVQAERKLAVNRHENLLRKK